MKTRVPLARRESELLTLLADVARARLDDDACALHTPMLASRTRALLRHELARLQTQTGAAERPRRTRQRRLHVGCGRRRVAGWLNVDLAGSDQDVDLTRPLPWEDAAFDTVVVQHVVEHLALEDELLPFLGELRRVAAPGARVWVSCPDMEKICKAYVRDRGKRLARYMTSRIVGLSYDDVPAQDVVNWVFHQRGTHKNLFDRELLSWALVRAGFVAPRRRRERHLLAALPGFPARGDDVETLLLEAKVPS